MVKVVKLFALVIQVQLRILEIQHHVVLGLLKLSNQPFQFSL